MSSEAESATEEAELDSRERILAAAEMLFAQQGVDKTSTREITSEAGVNTASVNYYFRSKEALTEEIFMQLAERVTAMRLRELEVCLNAASSKALPPDLDELIACFLRPYLEPGLHGSLLARLILDHRLHPNEVTKRVYVQHLDPFATKFIAALAMSDPDVALVEWQWRYHLMTGTVVLAMTDTDEENRMSVLSNGLADSRDARELDRELSAFVRRALSGKK